ncbi:mitochondrial thiamine pyrophosphate transporter [Scheffersomyces spartinae]|uniref:Mitochondrial thiamine pyrophosphate carrier 1 n=1 Tax=Scheffersomyces spartinae TaxID=45513 RepID=A0A9P7VD92_9ASCO|nr:mitochondrial thiamine pyrophosphate transporter [Scheffersomyces spartinae]KAG7195714.1 mitochondrial thiamine pyrophosphate transporter [Scheffersomyces spartinae]
MTRQDHLGKGKQVSPFDALIAGSISGGAARMLSAPLDTIKIRLQLQTNRYKERINPWQMAQNIIKGEGITALWKGNVPAEALYVLYGAIQFSSYTYLNNQFNRLNLNPSAQTLLIGTISGVISTALTYPFDLLRTRMAANSQPGFVSVSSVSRTIMKEHGLKGFYLGFVPATVSIASYSGIMFCTYEWAREFSLRFQKEVPFVEGFCGFIAGTVSKGATFPLDTIRKRTQVQKIKISLVEMAKRILRVQ